MPKSVICGRECGNKEGDLTYARLFPRVSGSREGVALQRVALRRSGCITGSRLTGTKIQDRKHISYPKLICPLRFVNNFLVICPGNLYMD